MPRGATRGMVGGVRSKGKPVTGAAVSRSAVRHHDLRLVALDGAEVGGVERGDSKPRRIAVATDHNILARTDKSDAKGLATSAASASPMAAASANPLDHYLTFGIYRVARWEVRGFAINRKRLPHTKAKSAPRSSRGALPVQRLQAWLKELGSSKPKSQAILEIGIVSSSR